MRARVTVVNTVFFLLLINNLQKTLVGEMTIAWWVK